MSDPRVFISFDFDHNKTDKDLFVGQARNSKTPFSIEDWSSKSSLPEKEWEKKINEKINKCNILIVLVGKKMDSADGVKKEIKMAKDNDVPIFGVYVDEADSKSNLPDGLPRYKTIKWEWDKIADKIDEAMKEGKNK